MLTAIVDLQFGSTGKGLIAGYLSQKDNFDLVVSANMPNAGHTFVDKEGRKWINKVLPSGVYSPALKHIAIGPGAVFDPARLVQEIEELRVRNIMASVIIHPNAALLMAEHKDAEQALNGIASTMQGSMEAAINKMRRRSTVSNVVDDCRGYLQAFNTVDGTNLANHICDHDEWFRITNTAQNILMEGSQGYSLGINAGFYPYCTSRDCTVWRLIADCGLTMKDRMHVIGTARVHPIRVGHTVGGYSGDHYGDQEETSWEALGVPAETTTVTGRVRRVFTFSHQQVSEAIIANRVDEVFLNFCNYDPRAAIQIAERINEYGNRAVVERHAFAGLSLNYQMVGYMGFGPRAEDVLEVAKHDRYR